MKMIFIFKREMMNETHSPPLTDKWLNQLQEAGYRLTEPRRAVVATIAASQRALNPNQVFDLSRERCASLGLVTVYRTLAKLEELSLIQRVHQPDGCHAYIAAVSGHQHLLICQDCGRAEYFGGDAIEPLMDRVGRESGYLICDHWLQLFGTCGACQVERDGKKPAEEANDE
jgi:Fur family transcriptional regulator, ferric uptake regulator